ncbi:MAG TPA: phosphate signaling complex protein PhoU [Nocardioidaceae bacterium]|nr:phosphate signaling complex protein PhoU [Nocardioidaceae bacterium]
MRTLYLDQLDTILDDVVAMTHEVRTQVRAATAALLGADGETAERVVAADRGIDMSRTQIEEASFGLMALQQPVAGDLRILVAALRMVADLERMGDLAVHVAEVARMRVPSAAVPTVVEVTIRRMGMVAENMVATVAEILAGRDVDGARLLEADDDEMDRLHASLFRQMLGQQWRHGVESAVDVALLGRYYERIADHAVSVARRLVYVETGEFERG